ncbi:hypothetical protein GCM10007853_28290 [Algimonas ampicilliniresistens]|uniref:Acyltransferase 3 domain-containing protein n=1 Tax=Algimonas ampicilliniresistens TaxID=1298735 RepID=A0ABQ5VCZ4_9PROT|nr:acyltransferase family protein [Algimonas ampicilliniresistens]GLQ24955.1 hypothetical protein GCM10007853_28290 [Algimonas ampicilliniresistens]
MTRDRTVLERLNAVRLIVVVMISIGYASTMAVGPHAKEWLHTFGYDPSWFGIQVLFFLSGWLAWRSLTQGRTGLSFLVSRAKRTLPWVALYTLVVVAVLYPALCNHDAPVVKGTGQLGLYFIKTVLLIDPGGPMPGALDNALYACLLQGTIWTLRWGMVAYFGLLILFTIGLRNRAWLAALFVITLLGHLSVSWWTLKTGSTLFEPIIPGLRVGYAFLLGALLYGARNRLPSRGRSWLAITSVTFGLAAFHYYFLPWTHLIEVIATIGFCALAMTVLQSGFKPLGNWPNITLPAYLGIWPVTQTLLALNPNITVPTLVVASLSVTIAIALILRGVADLLSRPVHRRVQPA